MSVEASTPPQIDRAAAHPVASLVRWAAARRAILADAVAGLRRNLLMAGTAVTTIAVALTVTGGGLLLTANLGHMAALLEGQVEVVAFLRRGLPTAQQQRVVEAARAVPQVRTVTPVGRAEALRRLQRTFGALAAVEGLLHANPLPDTIEVRVTDAGRVREVAAALKKIKGVDEVVFGATVVDRLVALTRAVRLAGGVLSGLLLAAALLIIVNTIRLTVVARRQEIEIMTLVGATSQFVRGPFIAEGALQGVAAALVATVVLVAGYAVLAGQAAAALPFLPVLAPGEALPLTVAAIWLTGVAVGILGSTIGVRRYLRT